MTGCWSRLSRPAGTCSSPTGGYRGWEGLWRGLHPATPASQLHPLLPSDQPGPALLGGKGPGEVEQAEGGRLGACFPTPRSSGPALCPTQALSRSSTCHGVASQLSGCGSLAQQGPKWGLHWPTCHTHLCDRQCPKQSCTGRRPRRSQQPWTSTLVTARSEGRVRLSQDAGGTVPAASLLTPHFCPGISPNM